jgi:hypothetical protein
MTVQTEVFEEYIQSTIDRGANDRETALRWIVESSGWSPLEMTSVEYICYVLNIPYSYQNELQPVLREMYKEFYGLKV